LIILGKRISGIYLEEKLIEFISMSGGEVSVEELEKYLKMYDKNREINNKKTLNILLNRLLKKEQIIVIDSNVILKRKFGTDPNKNS
jgi:predicted transcriptional regulator